MLAEYPLIEPLWNWNVRAEQNRTERTAFNRTIVELKRRRNRLLIAPCETFNRTIVELKQVFVRGMSQSIDL